AAARFENPGGRNLFRRKCFAQRCRRPVWRGCQGEVISNRGLVLTNHHCGFSQIQAHSTIEHNYVENGFWAKEQSQEIPCAGLTVTFIIRIENVTDKIQAALKQEMTAQERDQKIAEICAK